MILLESFTIYKCRFENVEKIETIYKLNLIDIIREHKVFSNTCVHLQKFEYILGHKESCKKKMQEVDVMRITLFVYNIIATN